jgi:trk system potassium uptake protein TrkH
MRRLLKLPFLVILMGIGALAMYLPAAQAYAAGQPRVGQPFFYCGTLLLVLTAMVALATAHVRPRNVSHSHLTALVAAYALLPLMFAVPFSMAVPDTGFASAWFEMVSTFTTTGMTLYGGAGRLPDAVHLWRALTGWLGGLFVLVTAAAVLAPMNLGGFEVINPHRGGAAVPPRLADPSERLIHHAATIAPAYALVTLVLCVALLIAGEPGLVALCHAMGTLSTSAISPVQGLQGGQAGIAGEILVFLGLMFAVSRRALPVPGRPRIDPPLWRDPEVRIAAVLCTTLTLLLFARHWLGAVDAALQEDAVSAAGALWGALFTVLSSLTTTGWQSQEWGDARAWSGLESPGLLLLGLAVMGGGVATTAGGVKLFRVYALYRHSRREMERIAHPNSIGGGGPAARALRRDGANVAFVFFMLFALTLGLVNAGLALAGLEFDRALVLSVAALTTTGPLVALDPGDTAATLAQNGWLRAVLGAAMVLGRLETLAILALFAPGGWRR